MTEPKEFCESCQRWLEHDQRYCPLFPDVKPPRRINLAFPFVGKKWAECVCLIHTCYEAPRRDKAASSTYRD